MTLEYCKEIMNNLYEFFNERTPCEDTKDIVIDEENVNFDDDYMNARKESPSFPSERLRRALSVGNIKEKSFGLDENLIESSTNHVFRGTNIPTKLEIKLSIRSERKLFELGCYLSAAHKVGKAKQKGNFEEKKVKENCINKCYQDCLLALKPDQDILQNGNLIEQQKNKDVERITLSHHLDTLLHPSQYCKYKKHLVTVRVKKHELRQAYYQEHKLEILKKKNHEVIKENSSKQVGNQNTIKSFEKKIKKPLVLSTVYKRKKCKHHRRDKDCIAGVTHGMENLKKVRLLPQANKLNCSSFENEVKIRREVKNKLVQTNHKEMLNDLTQLLKKHKRLQEKNKLLSESLSCLLANFDTTSSMIVDKNYSLSQVIESSSIPINNLHKFFKRD